MRLERLQIRNYRRFREADVEFPDGLVGLVGRNGAGKSTFLEAIAWCLFGHDAARTGKDLLRFVDAAPDDDVRVTLQFRHAGHAYEVRRMLLGKSQSHVAELLVDGVSVVPAGAQSHREVTKYLERVFHMDRTAFFTSLVARQRELNALGDMTPGRRREVLLRMLRVDAVDEAVRQVRSDKRELRAHLQGLEAGRTETEALQTRKKEIATRRAEVEDARRAATERLGALEREAEEARKARARWDELAEAHADLQRRIAERRERRAQKERDLRAKREESERLLQSEADLAELAPQAEELPAARKRLEELTLARERHLQAESRRKELEKVQAERERLVEEIAQATERIARVGPSRRMLERVRRGLQEGREELQAGEARVSELTADARVHRAKLDEAQGNLARIDKLGRDSPCPTCTRPLHEHYDDLRASFREQIRAAEGALQTLESRRKELTQTQEGLRDNLRQMGEREQELLGKVEEASRLEASLEGLKREADAADARRHELQEEVRKLTALEFSSGEYDGARHRVQRLERVAEKVATLRADVARRPDVEALVGELADDLALTQEALTNLEKQALDLGYDRAAHDAARQRADDARDAIGEKRVELERLAGDLRALAKEIEDVEAALEREKTREREIERIRQELAYLERLAGDRDGGLLVEFRSDLVSRIRPSLAAFASDTYRDLTDGRYAGLDVDENYDVLVQDGGTAYALDRFSGGESDLANLCLRLAVSRVLAERAGGGGFEFIALDEVFGSLDEVRKANLLRVLASLRNTFRQVLVVTHVEDVKDAVEHVLRVTEGPDGSATLTME